MEIMDNLRNKKSSHGTRLLCFDGSFLHLNRPVNPIRMRKHCMCDSLSLVRWDGGDSDDDDDDIWP